MTPIVAGEQISTVAEPWTSVLARLVVYAGTRIRIRHKANESAPRFEFAHDETRPAARPPENFFELP